jgi:hypothetical protein
VQLAAGTLVVRRIGLPRLRTSLEWVYPTRHGPDDERLTGLIRDIDDQLRRGR